MSTQHDPYEIDHTDFAEPQPDDDDILKLVDLKALETMKRKAHRNIRNAMNAKRQPSRQYLAEQLRVINLCNIAAGRLQSIPLEHGGEEDTSSGRR